MELFATRHPLTTDVDISSQRFWSLPFPERDRAFARLRAEAPVSWHPPIDVPYQHDQQGFWAVTRAADITAVSRNSELFQSRYGTTLDPVSVEEATGATFILTMDPPEHSRYRSLISAAFTPRAVRQITERIERNAAAIVDSLIGAGDIDFVHACSNRLPMTTVSDIVGVPESRREEVTQAAETLVGGGDAAGLPREEYHQAAFAALLHLYQVGADLAAHRRRHPADDLMTNLVRAEIDGHRLTDENIGAFMVLMSVAGNDTTKQATTRTMLSLQEHPEQREWLLADLDGRIMQAVDEFVRHATPVMQFTRTAARDTELGGAQIAAGDKVALFYCSGNRDETVFDRPDEFDLSRPRSPHVGFGGGGAHFCLGHNVAKTQLRAIISEILTRIPKIEFGEPVPLRSTFIHGIEALPAHIA
ncbi:cytochrome P450 [Actinomadura rugatobispora]|uniref:Cytochrome P450 n=1 Tax=Actinomadura rugatobispora TaxID=1994 RepID=A0ABW0ZT79_9ACTN|nr:cytochrome P450 [Actinomadura rugatobispora]